MVHGWPKVLIGREFFGFHAYAGVKVLIANGVSALECRGVSARAPSYITLHFVKRSLTILSFSGQTETDAHTKVQLRHCRFG